jgi:2-dehydro-3-deoxy-phosphogluconate/2-dehydro-3-deoxy-6-phosphogalactonate aldolase
VWKILKKLKFTPVITPFFHNKVDLEIMKVHIKNLIKKGIDGIFICGSTSLCPSLSFPERLQMFDSLEPFYDRIILQVGSLNIEESLHLSELAKKAGVMAIAAYPPYYYPNIIENTIEKYYLKLSSIFPTFVYNFPAAIGRDVNARIVKNVNRNGGNLVGVKDTVNDPAHMLNFKYELGDDFIVLSGPDFLILNSIRLGIDGVVAGSSNYAPELIKEMFETNDLKKMMRNQRKINDLVLLAREYGQFAANYILIEALQGYSVGEPRPPIFPVDDDIKSELAEKARMIYFS